MSDKKGALDLDTMYAPAEARTTRVYNRKNLGTAAGSERTITSKDFPYEERVLRKIHGTSFDKYSPDEQYEMKRRLAHSKSSAPAKAGSGGGARARMIP